MIFQMASTSAYDKNEVQVYIIAEKEETIRIGDIIAIPMNDYTLNTFEEMIKHILRLDVKL